MNPKTGDVLWKTPGTFVNQMGVGNGVAYGTQGAWEPEQPILQAIDIATGKILWTTSILVPGSPEDAAYRDGEIYLAMAHQVPDARLLAFDASNGKLRWTSPVAVGYVGAAISLAAIGDVNVFVTSQDGHIYAFARSGGWLAWKAKFGKEAWPIDPVWVPDYTERSTGIVAPRRYASKLLGSMKTSRRFKKQ